MKNIVGVSFTNKGKIYNFSPQDLSLEVGEKVIVETENGLQLGVVSAPISEIDEKRLVSELKKVVRQATDKDIKQIDKNKKDALSAITKAEEIVKDLNLDMKIIDASYNFDRKQLIFQFLADGRVDFRELAKRLAAIYKTRIELRQIGVRDKAREIGGLGPCGRVLCCHQFLNDINGVTINMAKNQMLALNPTKINGCCGRLLCCLGFEDENYTELKKEFPNIGSQFSKSGKSGKVIEINIFTRTVKLETKENTIEEVTI